MARNTAPAAKAHRRVLGGTSAAGLAPAIRQPYMHTLLLAVLWGLLVPAAGLAAGGPTTRPINFWVLCPDRLAVPPPRSLELCQECVRAHRQGDSKALQRAMHELGEYPVAVELSSAESARRFALPGGDRPILEYSELSFGEGGHGSKTWGAGVALAIWTQCHAPFVSERRVLELGSGVGVGGLSAALAGAAHVTLSDVAEDERWPGLSTRLQANLAANAQTNGVGEATAAVALDWDSCLPADYAPERTYPRLIGSDLAYDERSVDALAAAVIKHLEPGGEACLIKCAAPTRQTPPGGFAPFAHVHLCRERAACAGATGRPPPRRLPSSMHCAAATQAS